jgi:DNA-binding transcriptional MerR regulator
MNKNSPTDGGLRIAALERDIGVGKDTLRVWERRYGFPQPHRDEFGERVYPIEQVERLRLIKRLMNKGQRPGALLRMSIAELREQTSSLTDGSEADQAAEWVMPLLKAHQVDLLRAEFSQLVAREGVERFVTETVPALNRRIGDGWMTGEIEIYEEHLYTELMQNQLRSSLVTLPAQTKRPYVLLTTVKDEKHLLGLLMVEALLSANGAWCFSLGAQTPALDIVAASKSVNIDIVALSFSGAYPWRKACNTLAELRAALPSKVELWAGGAALAGRERFVTGVVVLETLNHIGAAVAKWRAAHSTGNSATGVP